MEYFSFNIYIFLFCLSWTALRVQLYLAVHRHQNYLPVHCLMALIIQAFLKLFPVTLLIDFSWMKIRAIFCGKFVPILWDWKKTLFLGYISKSSVFYVLKVGWICTGHKTWWRLYCQWFQLYERFEWLFPAADGKHPCCRHEWNSWLMKK